MPALLSLLVSCVALAATNPADPPSPKPQLLVIYGVSHTPYLRQFGQDSGHFDVVDPLPFLTTDGAKPAGETLMACNRSGQRLQCGHATESASPAVGGLARRVFPRAIAQSDGEMDAVS